MLRRFYEVRKEVKAAMFQLDKDFDLTDSELATVKELCDALAPIEMAVQYFIS